MKHLKTFENYSVSEKKEIEISKEDEKKYLTPKQTKLPEGLKKAIIDKAKKEENK